MNTKPTTSPPPLITPTQSKKNASKKWLILAILLLIILTVIGIIWWINRPIRPVILNKPAQEKLEQKLKILSPTPQEPQYEPGKRELSLSQREINALLHQNTDMGDKLQLELATNAVHARAKINFDPEIPIVGGKTMRLKARFRVADDAGNPALIAEDVTVWGMSLPNEWLGGLKGKNLLQVLFGANSGNFPGIEQLHVKPGGLYLKLAE